MSAVFSRRRADRRSCYVASQRCGSAISTSCDRGVGDLAHPGDDIVDRLARTEMFTDVTVSAALACAGDDGVAPPRPASPGKASECPPSATASFVISRRARAVTSARLFR